jgi:signal transduction histidine kinase
LLTKRQRLPNRAKIDHPLFTQKKENVTTSRASIGALSSAEFLPQRVSLLYRLSGNDVPAILLTSVITAFALWGYISDKLLIAWLIWLVLASLVRIALKRAYRLRQPGPEAAGRWEGFFCLASASVGTAWGLTVLLLYPERGQFHEILLPFLIGSVAMGLPPALAPSPKAFACLIVPIFAPLIGLLFSQGGAFNTSAGILILVFSAVLLALYLSSNRALIETLRFGQRVETELLVAVQREKELSEMKSKFVSTASHEFRTPLATMLSSAELLEHYSENLSPAEKLNLLKTIQSGAKRMSEMIDDLLTLDESGVLKLNLEPTNLREVCGRVVSEFRIAQGKQHVITLDDRFDRVEAYMDERLLRHILNNLLSNAVKYSPPGSEVTFSLARRDEQAAIEIQDRGIGIPLEDQPRMFESFHRASNVENRPGTGLGLAIVKKAVELHGGEISLASNVGSGTRFTVMLPLRPAGQPVGAN